MRTWVCVDFETLSACDLKSAGAYRYAEDLSTEVLCLTWQTREGATGYIVGATMDEDLRAFASDPEVLFIAHNAIFEKAVWRNLMVPTGYPDIPNERWHDTLAVCAERVLPLKLEKASHALRLDTQKDVDGSKVTIGLSSLYRRGKPLGSIPHDRILQYCASDTAGEVELHRSLGWQQSRERQVYLLDQAINDHGVRLDRDYIHQSQRVVDRASVPLLEEFERLTGIDSPTKGAQLTRWLDSQGVAIPNLQKETVKQFLGYDIDAVDDDGASDLGYSDEHSDLCGGSDVVSIPQHAHRALHIRSLLASASVKKLAAMEACLCGDGYAHGLLQYHGAGTGRWAGRLLQPQNFPRGSIKLGDKPIDPALVVHAIMTGDPAYVEMLCGPAIETVAGGLRHAMVASPGHEFVVGDYAGIEARIVLALAGQHDKTAMMAAGEDVYCDMAQRIYGRPITKADVAERTDGKATVLGCGFQMGWRTFQRKYCPDKPDEFAQRVIEAYRKEWAPLVPQVWYGLERAATDAVWTRQPQEAFGVIYDLVDGWLTALLPSGRKIYYFNPQTAKIPFTYIEKPNHHQSLAFMGKEKTILRPGFTYQALKNNQWRTITSYGGLMTENVVQALARDLLVDAMFKCRDEGLPIALTVHDEIVLDVEKSRADYKALQQIMEDIPDWAKAIKVPVQAECWQGERYRK